MKLNEITWLSLESFEQSVSAFVAGALSSTTRFNRGVVIAAREAGFAADLPDWAQKDGPLDEGTLGLDKRDAVLSLAAEILVHVSAAKAPPDPN